MNGWIQKNWFLFALAAVLGIGAAGHQQFAAFVELGVLKNTVVFLVLFVMTLPLPAEAIFNVLKKPWPAFLAAGLNMGLVPAFAWIASGSLSAEMGEGLIVAAAAPCTVASAAVWTRRAGGNDAVAILVTIMTNLSCFLITPAWVYLLVIGDGDSEVQIDFWAMVLKLGWLVLLPMLLAQFARLVPRVGQLATRWKTSLSTLAQIGILYIVFVGIVGTSLHLSGGDQGSWNASEIGLVIVLSSGIHLAVLAIGLWIAKGLRFPRGDQIAVGFAASQKTLLIGLSVAIEVEASILPMVTYHVCQLILDTVIANRMSSRDEKRPARPKSSSNSPESKVS